MTRYYYVALTALRTFILLTSGVLATAGILMLWRDVPPRVTLFALMAIVIGLAGVALGLTFDRMVES